MAADEDVTGFGEPATKTIGLCMIVKDEAAVIERCLDSVRPLIDYVFVEDTGSTDGTQEIIRAWLNRHRLPGEVIEEPWRDFAFNRSHAMAGLRQNTSVDYALIMDADDFIVCDQEFDAGKFKAGLSHDQYSVELHEPSIRYDRLQLCRNALPYGYRGVVHEFLQGPPGASSGRASGFHIESRREGARSRDPNKYRRDAELLERALLEESDPFLRARYTFYLGQSYRDCGDKEKAVEAYLARAEQGFWKQEIYLSLYYAAQIKDTLKHPFEAVFATYQRAIETDPARVEARHGACRLCRIAGRNREGYEVGKPGLSQTPPAEALFLEPWVYDYGLLDEFSINAYWAEQYREALDAGLRLLGEGKLPEGERSRVLANTRFAVDKASSSITTNTLDLLIEPAGRSSPPAELPRPAAIRTKGSTSPLVSVITPTGNRPHFLTAALTYFRAQDYPNIEWLILDDSPKPFAKFARLPAKNIHYRHYAGPRMTIGEKRNRLVEQARGEIIVHFDDDDFYAPDYVSSMVGALVERGADLINLRGWYLYDYRSRFFGYWDLMQKEGLHYRCDEKGVGVILLDRQNNAGFANNHLGFGFSYAYRRKVWESHRFPHVDFNEDGEFSLAALGKFALDGIADTSGRCLHFIHPKSSSRCFPQYRLPAFELGKQFPGLALLPSEVPGSARAPADPIKAEVVPQVGATKSIKVLTDLPAPTLGADPPRVLLAIISGSEAALLPYYLVCLEALDYPKKSISLHVRASTGPAAEILEGWLNRVGDQYADIAFEAVDLPPQNDKPGSNKALSQLRQQSLDLALQRDCDFYFVVDPNNFIRPHTLRALITTDQAVVAPLIRDINEESAFANFHEATDANGYFANSEGYYLILYRRVIGLCPVDVVRSTYLIRKDAIPGLRYADGSGRDEYVVFSDSVRQQHIPQYVDNRDIYGYLTLTNDPRPISELLNSEFADPTADEQRAKIATPRSGQRTRGGVRRPPKQACSPIFLHASWRSSSTWFWSKFREVSETYCFYEPYTSANDAMTRQAAATWGPESWPSGHPSLKPYWTEYLPLLIRRSGGLRLFDPMMPYKWFIPLGGLRGQLRREETRYLALLIRHAGRRGKVPVLGLNASLGRIWAMKNSFGGTHIFQYRNLWNQWTSYLGLKRKGIGSFYDSTIMLILRRDEPYFRYLKNFFVGQADCPFDRAEVSMMQSLPEQQIFSMFMAMHIYLYLHASLVADVAVDVTKMAYDGRYRQEIENEIAMRANLSVSFSDAREEQHHSDLGFDTNAIDWDEIRTHAEVATKELATVASRRLLMTRASEWIEETRHEMAA